MLKIPTQTPKAITDLKTAKIYITFVFSYCTGICNFTVNTNSLGTKFPTTHTCHNTSTNE